jgi:hypothetical protein
VTCSHHLRLASLIAIDDLAQSSNVGLHPSLILLRQRLDFSKMIEEGRYDEAFGSLRSAPAAIAGGCIQQALVDRMRVIPEDATSHRGVFLQMISQERTNVAQ